MVRACLPKLQRRKGRPPASAPVLFVIQELPVECFGIHSQDFCRLAPLSSRLFEDLEDMLSFDIFEPLSIRLGASNQIDRKIIGPNEIIL